MSLPQTGIIIWHQPDSQITAIIRDGSSYEDFQSEMPGFVQALTDEEIEAVLAYIKTLWGLEELEIQATISAN